MSALVGPGSEVAATGPISASGAFSLLLPDTIAGASLGDIGPCDAVTVEPSGARGTFVLYLGVTDGDGDELGVIAHTNMDASLEQAVLGDAISSRFYLDRDATVLGTCVEDIGDEIANFVYDLDLSRGWNVVTITLSALTEGMRTLEVRGGPPAGVPWQFFGVAAPPPDPIVSSPTPEPVASDLVFVDVGAGFSHTCAVAEGGDVLCWGLNDHGQLGSVTEADCGHEDGPRPCSHEPIEMGGALQFASVVGGGEHSCGLNDAGQAFCWGRGDGGQLGDGRSESSVLPVAVAGDQAFTRLMTSPISTCGLTNAFELYCWGSPGDYTGLGGSVPTMFVSDVAFVSVSIGEEHACGLDADGAAWCWGSNMLGLLGTGQAWGEPSSEPLRVTGGLAFSEIVVTESLSCGLALDGGVHCWGFLRWDPFGITGVEAAPVPLPAGDAPPFVRLFAGYWHACGLTASGAAWCWGSNSAGELGDGTYDRPNGPAAVTGGLTFTELGLGWGYSCGVTHGGSLDCWGDDGFGQLGRGRAAAANTSVAAVPWGDGGVQHRVWGASLPFR